MEIKPQINNNLFKKLFINHI